MTTITPEIKVEAARIFWIRKRTDEVPTMSLDRLKFVEHIYSRPLVDNESEREKLLRLELLDALWRRRRAIKEAQLERRVRARETAVPKYKGVKR